MRKIRFIITISMFFCSGLLMAQMSTVLTSKPDQISKNHKTFIVLDESTGYVLAKQTEQYAPGEPMPLIFFSTEGTIQDYINSGGQRQIIVHDLSASNSGDQYDWVLQYDTQEQDIYFSRSNYISNMASTKWNVLVEGESIFLQNIQDKIFLSIDDQGDIYPSMTRQEATRWKLIYVY